MDRTSGTFNNNGQFTDGNPGTGVEATVVDAAWLNGMQEEIASLIEAAGVVLSAANNGQLLQAIQRMAGAQVTPITVNTTLTPDQTGLVTINANAGPVTITLPAASSVLGGTGYLFRRNDASANTITIQRGGGDTIDSGTSYALTAVGEVIQMLSNNLSLWRKASSNNALLLQGLAAGQLLRSDGAGPAGRQLPDGAGFISSTGALLATGAGGGTWKSQGGSPAATCHEFLNSIGALMAKVDAAGDFWTGANRCLTTADEGSGNGLDADMLDGLNASAFSPSGFSGASVLFSGVQIMATATVTRVNLDAEEFDFGGYHDLVTNPERITVPMDGVYRVSGGVGYQNFSAGRRQATIRKNGVVIAANSRNATTTSVSIPVERIVTCLAGDYFELYGYHTQGTDVALVAVSNFTYLQIEYLGT